MKKLTLLKQMKKTRNKDRIRLHMPGAKGKGLGFLNGIFKYEFTELCGLDNLYSPKGVVKDMQDDYASKIDAKAVAFLVNGSSAGILSMLSMFKGKKLIMSRDFHVSVANAIRLFDIKPIYIDPTPIDGVDISGVVSNDDIEKAINSHTDASGVFLTYPNYYGFCADITRISELAKSASMALVLDAAHAACFYLSDQLPKAPNVADVWVTSLHKTMPALNQTGYVGISHSSRFEIRDIKQAINIFQTTSPSYVLLASIAFACQYFDKNKISKLDRLIEYTYEIEKKINNLSCFCAISSIEYNKDPLKLVVDHTKCKYSRQEIEKAFQHRGIYFELIDTRFMLFMLSPISTKSDLNAVYRVLISLDHSDEGAKKQTYYPSALPKTVHVDACGKTCYINIADSENRVCANPVGVYPPGVPVLMKGDVITPQIIEYMQKAIVANLGTIGIEQNKVLVYQEKE
jgi:arginine/lysine/ornithine decarboxylase